MGRYFFVFLFSMHSLFCSPRLPTIKEERTPLSPRFGGGDTIVEFGSHHENKPMKICGRELPLWCSKEPECCCENKHSYCMHFCCFGTLLGIAGSAALTVYLRTL